MKVMCHVSRATKRGNRNKMAADKNKVSGESMKGMSMKVTSDGRPPAHNSGKENY